MRVVAFIAGLVVSIGAGEVLDPKPALAQTAKTFESSPPRAKPHAAKSKARKTPQPEPAVTQDEGSAPLLHRSIR